MSYILDALKKSDKERQQGTVPGLQSVHAPFAPPPETGKRTVAAKLSALIFLFMGVVATAGFWVWRDGFNVMNTDAPVTSVIRPQASQEKTVSRPVGDSTPVVQPSVDTSQEVVLEPVPILLSETQVVSSLPGEGDGEGVKKSLPRLEQLSPVVQAEIPELAFAGHTYSSAPARRLIIINKKIVREGEAVVKDLKLVEITWSGVIMRYKDVEFQVEI